MVALVPAICPAVSRLGRASLVLTLAALSCGYSLDLGTKSGVFIPAAPPSGLALARIWDASDALCDSGRQVVSFDRDDQLASFLLPLSADVGLLVVADGASGLDTTLALYGPQGPDGAFPADPVATSDDSGASRGAAIAHDVGSAPGLYLLSVSTFGGVGRGIATLTVASDGKLGCSRCVTGDASRPFGGCLDDATCIEEPCVAAGVDWSSIEETISATIAGDPCGELPAELTCLRRSARHGDDWPSRADRRIAHADVVAGGLSADRLAALTCLSRHPNGGLIDVAPRPASRAPGDVRPALELTLGTTEAEVDAALSANLGPLLGRLTGLTDDFTLVSRWTRVDGGGMWGQYQLGSYRGIPFVRDDALVASIRLLPTECEGRWVLDTLSIPANTLESTLLDEALATEPVTSELAHTTASLACGAGCSDAGSELALPEPALVFAGGRLIWQVSLPCTRTCSNTDGSTVTLGPGSELECGADGTCGPRAVGSCTWTVDARSGAALAGRRDCCGACDALRGDCGDDCAAPCGVHEWRCPATGRCHDATASLVGREGYEFCRSCLGLESAECACFTRAGARADSEPCWIGDDVVQPGMCVNGTCLADNRGAESCAQLERELRSLFDSPAGRACQGDGECVSAAAPVGCNLSSGDPMGALNAGSWPTFEKIYDLWSTYCTAWRSAQFTSAAAGFPVNPVCNAGRCLADDELCP